MGSVLLKDKKQLSLENTECSETYAKINKIILTNVNLPLLMPRCYQLPSNKNENELRALASGHLDSWAVASHKPSKWNKS